MPIGAMSRFSKSRRVEAVSETCFCSAMFFSISLRKGLDLFALRELNRFLVGKIFILQPVTCKVLPLQELGASRLSSDCSVLFCEQRLYRRPV